MANRTMSAPLAVIKVNGVAIGKMKTIRCTENVRYGKTVGLGRLNPDEMLPLDWAGSLSCSAFLVDLRQPVLPGSLNRTAQTVEQWADTLTLSVGGIQIDILRKIPNTTNSQGIITPKYEIVASIKGVFCTREAFDISEGQISGRDVDFEYITPILFPI